MTSSGGTWIAWNGSHNQSPKRLCPPIGPTNYDLRFVNLNSGQIRGYYLGLANQLLWPLCHGFIDRCAFSDRDWATYLQVNQIFASALSDEASPNDNVWIHDYHLALVPRMIKTTQFGRRVGFFWHIPFPALGVYMGNPWRREILEGLLGSDVVAFHCQSYVDNFLDCVERFTPHTVNRIGSWIAVGQRIVRVKAVPLGIDANQFDNVALSHAVRSKAEAIKLQHKGRRIALSVERLDYTKGIVERLKALELLFVNIPGLQGQWSILQIAAPGREQIPAYKDAQQELREAVRSINRRFGTADWQPVTLIERSLERPEVVAHYLAADLAIVTPLSDGMNLVAKEFVASKREDDGTLVLSRFAGAAEQLGGDAVLVDPRDRLGFSEGIRRAMEMDMRERRARARRMRRQIGEKDLYWWSDQLHQELRNETQHGYGLEDELSA